MRLNWIYVLCAIVSFSASAENQGYRVHSKAETLIQIARDIYKDERQWKEIAYWNGLKPPYHLDAGQVLVLKQPAAIPQANAVAPEELARVKPRAKRAPVAQQIEKHGDTLIYVVNERAPSLMMVARELYGDEKMARKISAWGGFEPNARLDLGQRLRLQVPPTKTAAEGTAILIENWRARGNDIMVERLGGTAVSERQPATAPKSAKKKKCDCDCCEVHAGKSAHKKSAAPSRSAASPAPASPAPASPAPASPAQSGGPSMAPGSGAPAAAQSATGSASAANSAPGAAVGSAPSAPAPSEDESARQPQSTEYTLQPKQSDSPDGIPTAHKTETYWLGDEAAHLIQVLENKLRGR